MMILGFSGIGAMTYRRRNLASPDSATIDKFRAAFSLTAQAAASPIQSRPGAGYAGSARVRPRARPITRRPALFVSVGRAESVLVDLKRFKIIDICMKQNAAIPRALRRRVFKDAVIQFNGIGLACVVKNISMTGALLLASTERPIEQLTLVVVSENLVRKCRVVWRESNKIGVAFI
jgi:hypothetical protein